MVRLEQPFESREQAAARTAFGWAVIPLTRAIDTLVLQVSGSGLVSDQIDAVGKQLADLVDWVQA